MSQIDQAKFERVLRLISLLGSNVNYTINELAEKLDTSYRSIYRYLETFKDAGFVVDKDANGFYHIGRDRGKYKELSDVIYFSDEEAALVNQVIDAFDDDNVLKQNLKRKLANVYNCTSMAKCSYSSLNAMKVSNLEEAIRNSMAVKLVDYQSSSSQAVKSYCVEPFAFTTNYVQVWCYDIDAGCVKIFRLSRIGEVKILPNRAKHQSDHKVGDLDIFRFTGKADKHLRLELGLMAYNLIQEEYPLCSSYISNSNGKWILDVNVCNWAGPCRFFLGLMDDIRIVDSPEFEEYVSSFLKNNWKTEM